MKYISLVGDLKTFRAQASCPECKERYDLRKVQVFGIFRDTVFFSAFCRKCDRKSIIQIQIEEKKAASVSERDVELLKENLKDFGGNINNFLDSLGK